MVEQTPSDRGAGTPPANRGERVRQALEQRDDVLDALLDQPLTKLALVEQLNVSRSTVDRALKALTAQGLVRRDDGAFVASAAGRLAYESVEQHHETMADIERAAPLLEHLPPDVTVDAAVLEGATVHRPTSGAGRQALRAAMSVVSGADTVYACSRAITDTSAPTAAYRLVVEAGATLEVVYAPNVATYIRNQHTENRHEMVTTGRYRAFQASSLPFGLFIATSAGETKVAVAIYDTEESLVGVMTNDTDATVEWAESVYRRYRQDATEFTDAFTSTV